MTEAQYKCVNIRWKNMSLEVDIKITLYQLKQYESRNWKTKSQGAWGTCNQCLWQLAAVSRRHLNQSQLSPVPSCCYNIDQHPTQTINEPDCTGTYYPLTGMSDDVQQQLIDDHFLFKEGDRFLQVSESDLKQHSCMCTGSKCKQILANRPRHFPQRGEDVPSLGWWRGPPSHHLHGAWWRCWSCVPAADRRDRTHGSTSNCQANICLCAFSSRTPWCRSHQMRDLDGSHFARQIWAPPSGLHFEMVRDWYGLRGESTRAINVQNFKNL